MTQCSVSRDREVGRQTESSAEEASWATPAFSLWIRPTFFKRPSVPRAPSAPRAERAAHSQLCYCLPATPTPSSWSLDSGKEAKSMSDGGKLLSPPVPPRPTGAYSKRSEITFIK